MEKQVRVREEAGRLGWEGQIEWRPPGMWGTPGYRERLPGLWGHQDTERGRPECGGTRIQTGASTPQEVIKTTETGARRQKLEFYFQPRCSRSRLALGPSAPGPPHLQYPSFPECTSLHREGRSGAQVGCRSLSLACRDEHLPGSRVSYPSYLCG